MKETRVRMFTYRSDDWMEDRINDFLDRKPSIGIKDIKITQSEDEKGLHITVMIIYEIDR